MKCGVRSRFVEAGQKPAVAALAGCAIAFYLAYHLTRFPAVKRMAPRPARGCLNHIRSGAKRIRAGDIFIELHLPVSAGRRSCLQQPQRWRTDDFHGGLVLPDGGRTGRVCSSESGSGKR